MGYIPRKAKWYVAEIVEQIRVEGDPRYLVHTNTVLIRGDSPEEAYAKAVELGTDGQASYENRKRLVNRPCVSTRDCEVRLISGLLGGRCEGLPIVRQ
jgi:Domain of unknown function (DUF4288)